MLLVESFSLDYFHFTGLGGGFNERQNVEYKEREESDDEFDEVYRNILRLFITTLHCTPWRIHAAASGVENPTLIFKNTRSNYYTKNKQCRTLYKHLRLVI